ncbi:Glycerophosphoryl diester phosphodiesterase [Actinosynnema pretiosum subsp. pretiosum]|nr:Glycerophosphoryl diester phosphodiesterase [Actinosynnema pretiosum subsp. pretiosum]
MQGFSGVLRTADGTFDVLSDNGYGARATSADFVLRIQRIAPDFASGAVDVVGGLNLTDPHRHVPFPLTRTDRVLTGADLDVEPVQRGADGSYWTGDEFGPYLLHFDRAGRLLAPPSPLPGVRAPQNPEGSPNLGGSKGFESLALSPDGRTLDALLEGAVAGDAHGTLRLNEFDIAKNRFTGKKRLYRLDDPAHAIGDAVAVDRNRLLVIERDGALDKTPVADLVDIANPRRIGGFPERSTFPFTTVDGLLILDDRTIAVLNDNNSPSSSGRTPGKPDDNECITLDLGDDLD